MLLRGFFKNVAKRVTGLAIRFFFHFLYVSLASAYSVSWSLFITI